MAHEPLQGVDCLEMRRILNLANFNQQHTGASPVWRNPPNMEAGCRRRSSGSDEWRIVSYILALLFSPGVLGAEPAVTAESRDLVSTYNWGYKSGVKQQHGSYKNGRSLHAILRRTGSGEQGYPDNLVWFDEHTGQIATIERAVAYPEIGLNPATHAVFASDAHESGQGRIWWVMGGRANAQPFDMVRSLEPFNPFDYEVVLNNFVTEPHSTTPSIAVVGETGLLAYRWRGSGSRSGEIRYQDYLLSDSNLPTLRSEKSLGRGSFVADLGDITIEQLWSRWDPRHRAFALTWQWFAHDQETTSGNAFGSNPFIYTDDFGATWRSADGTQVNLPLTYLAATAVPAITPHDHFSLGENTGWLPRDLGFTPGGLPWITLVTGAIDGNTDGWQSTLFRWVDSTWQAVPLSNDMEGNADAMACGPVRDFLVCAYSELGTAGSLLVKASRDEGQTWSAPVVVDSVGMASTGALQRIHWVSFAQPADRYLDNVARFFVGYYRVDEPEGKAFKNRLRWVRVQVGPRADFNGDEMVDDRDWVAFEAAHIAADWRADFNDDGVVDERDRSDFAAAMADDDPGLPVSVPDVVGLAQSAASAEISSAGLVVGTVKQQSSTTVPAGSVISQNPAAGASVALGSAVNLVVSSGAAAASASVNPTSLAFGNQALNVATPAMTVAITNTGTVVVPINSITLAEIDPGQFLLSTSCPDQLQVDGSCTAAVIFTPTSTGTKSADLTIAFGAGVANGMVSVSGTGVQSSLSVSPTSLSFGKVARGTTSTAKTVTITNTGTVVLPVTSITIAGAKADQFRQSDDCPDRLPVGGMCAATVVFVPTSKGSKSAKLSVVPGGGAAAVTVALNGSGT